jgi:hypothetical protein
VGVKRDVYGNTSIECNRGKVLVKEGLEEDDFIPLLEECNENGVLT